MQRIKKPRTRGIFRADTVRVYPSSLEDVFNYAKHSEETHPGVNPQAVGRRRPRPPRLGNDHHHETAWRSDAPPEPGSASSPAQEDQSQVLFEVLLELTIKNQQKNILVQGSG